MMRGVRLLACLAVATGCSQVFGLEEPVRGDAAQSIDAVVPADAVDDAPAVPRSLIEIITDAQLQNDLLVVLDAGDASSYDGTGQVWNNLVVNGVDFTRGATALADTDDPTFHGVAGARTAEEYFTFDGADLFRETASGWGDDEFHKDGLQLTMLAVAWVTPTGPGPMLFANCRCSDPSRATPGFVFFRASQTGFQAIYIEGEQQMSLQTSTAAIVPTNAWSFMAVSAAANGITDVVHQLNTTFELYPSEAHPYGGNNADGPATIGAMSNGVNAAADGTRIAMLAIWKRPLSTAELAMVHDAVRAERFPSLP